MNKNLLWALLILVITVIVLIFNNGGRVDVDFPFHLSITGIRSLVYLAFLSIGVAIGVLIK